MAKLDALFDKAVPTGRDSRVITIRGAREHNLKNVDLTIPKDRLVVFTGLSGSGKSGAMSSRYRPMPVNFSK